MGYPFRSRLESDPKGDISVIQMKDIDDHNRLDTSHLTPVHLRNINPAHLVNPGDLIFRSRGRVNTASLVSHPLDKTVVAAPLFRIRPATDKVLPAYLAWYINQPQAQAYLERQASGTISRMIHKKTVSEMAIELPPLERQHQVARLAALAGREQELLQRLAEKRKIYADGILIKLAQSKP